MIQIIPVGAISVGEHFPGCMHAGYLGEKHRKMKTTVAVFLHKLQGHMNQRGLFFHPSEPHRTLGWGKALLFIFPWIWVLDPVWLMSATHIHQASSTPQSTHCKTPLNISASFSHAMLSVLFSKCRKSLVWEAQGHTTDVLEPWFSTF